MFQACALNLVIPQPQRSSETNYLTKMLLTRNMHLQFCSSQPQHLKNKVFSNFTAVSYPIESLKVRVSTVSLQNEKQV